MTVPVITARLVIVSRLFRVSANGFFGLLCLTILSIVWRLLSTGFFLTEYRFVRNRKSRPHKKNMTKMYFTCTVYAAKICLRTAAKKYSSGFLIYMCNFTQVRNKYHTLLTF